MKQNDYEDIIRLPHHVSSVHPRMSMTERAAQFSPFAALTGYEGVIRERARQTEERAELDEGVREELDRKLEVWERELGNRRAVRITYFQPDARKDGGTYVTVTGRVKKADGYRKVLELENGLKIPAADIVSFEESGPEDGAEEAPDRQRERQNQERTDRIWNCGC